ncbi:MAG: hypothetical protein ACW99U_16165 [Candidatus Thorarchaeota archaeon]
MTRQSNLTKETSVVVTYPIVSALLAAEEFIKDASGWKPINDSQREFMEEVHTLCKGELPSITEIESIAHTDVEFINSWLQENGFDIKLEPFDAGGFGTASILDLIGHWSIKGNKATLVTDESEYFSGVRIDSGGVAFHSLEGDSNLIVALTTRNHDIVYMKMADEAPTGLEMVRYVEDITQRMTESKPRYDSVIFPKIDLNSQGPLEWLLNMELTTPQGEFPFYFIQQALQQTKLKMNEDGFRVKSAVAVAAMLGAGFPDVTPYLIKRPFLMWITRPSLCRPLFVAYLNKDVWKDPGGLDM